VYTSDHFYPLLNNSKMFSVFYIPCETSQTKDLLLKNKTKQKKEIKEKKILHVDSYEVSLNSVSSSLLVETTIFYHHHLMENQEKACIWVWAS